MNAGEGDGFPSPLRFTTAVQGNLLLFLLLLLNTNSTSTATDNNNGTSRSSNNNNNNNNNNAQDALFVHTHTLAELGPW